MMKKPNIILIGGGGHCVSCIDVIEQEGKFTIAGIIDVKEKLGQTILGYPIIGTDEDLSQISKKYDNFLITIGHIKSNQLRVKLYNQIKKLEKQLPTIISPLSYVSKHAILKEGTIVMHNVLINALCKIGTNCIINTKSLIEHDTIIYNNCHIATNATINGNCTINADVFIGSNTVINQGIIIARDCTIGSGSVITKNIVKENTTWVGNPAQLKQ